MIVATIRVVAVFVGVLVLFRLIHETKGHVRKKLWCKSPPIYQMPSVSCKCAFQDHEQVRLIRCVSGVTSIGHSPKMLVLLSAAQEYVCQSLRSEVIFTRRYPRHHLVQALAGEDTGAWTGDFLKVTHVLKGRIRAKILTS